MSIKIAIIGAGTGGVPVAARLARQASNLDITIIEPKKHHYYQPLWTMVGAGIVKRESTQRDVISLIPKGVKLLEEAVLAIDPEAQKLKLSSTGDFSYDYLVVANGLKLNWAGVEGLEAGLGSGGVASIYDYDQALYVNEMIQNFKGGRAVFIMPPTPIKCAGAPQKIMYLAENIWRNKGIRDRCEIMFVSAGPGIFGVPEFAKTLNQIVDERGIITRYAHKLRAVDMDKKVAHFVVSSADGSTTNESIDYDFLHVVPPMVAPELVANSALAAQDGPHKSWLAVDKHTLQHLKYPNVFGIGDITGVPNSKTGAAIRKQYPVVCENLIAQIKSEPLPASYDGYSSCPLTTELGKVMLAEFGYDGKLLPSFPLDPSIPRRSYWTLTKDLLPQLYWHGMMRGIFRLCRSS